MSDYEFLNLAHKDPTPYIPLGPNKIRFTKSAQPLPEVIIPQPGIAIILPEVGVHALSSLEIELPLSPEDIPVAVPEHAIAVSLPSGILSHIRVPSDPSAKPYSIKLIIFPESDVDKVVKLFVDAAALFGTGGSAVSLFGDPFEAVHVSDFDSLEFVHFSRVVDHARVRWDRRGGRLALSISVYLGLDKPGVD